MQIANYKGNNKRFFSSSRPTDTKQELIKDKLGIITSFSEQREFPFSTHFIPIFTIFFPWKTFMYGLIFFSGEIL